MVTRRFSKLAILLAAAITINACVQIASSERLADNHAMINKPLVIRGGAVANAQEIAFYVSLEGSDDSNGNGPVATLKRAVELASRETHRDQPITIYLREGTHRVASTVAISGSLSGLNGRNTTIRSYPGEHAVVTGGVVLDEFRRIDDESVTKRLSRAARSNVLVAEIPSSEMRDLGFINPVLGNRAEVYHNGILATLARYPNDGWLEIESVPQSGEKMIHPGLDRDTSAVPRGRHYGRFEYSGDRPSRWAPADDIWIHGYWTWDWADQHMRVLKLDTEQREIYPTTPHHRYGYTAGQRFIFLNVLEELDAPGEWYIDRRKRRLYYWPMDDIEPGSVVLSGTAEPLIEIKGASNVAIESIGFEAGRSHALRIEGGSGNTIAGCEFRNFGLTAVVVAGGVDHRVVSCDIHDTGGGGISASGGDRNTLSAGNITIENNHIHHFAQRIRTYQPAIQIGGVANRVANNVIHDAPHMGVNIDGNDHVLELNEVYHIAEETGDVGAFYMGRDWTERGVIFRYNFIHELYGPGQVGVMGIYLDDAASGAEIRNNIFYKAGRAAFIGGGRDVVISGNVFVDCAPAVHIDARGLGWASGYIVRGGSWRMYQKLAQMSYDSEPYALRYPGLASILDGDPAVPEGNRVEGNLHSQGKWLDLDSRIPKETVSFEENVTDAAAAVAEYVKAIAATTDRSLSPPRISPFDAIPITDIGLYSDEYRSDEYHR